MLDTNKLPSEGYILAYSREKILFDSYKLDNNFLILGNGGKFDDKDFYEIHCFDNSQEYRIFTAHGELHEILLSEHDESEQENFDRFIYRDEQLLQEKYSRLIGCNEAKIIVINRFAYTEDDAIYLAGYRLGGVILE
ncbi:MAG: hypothetical protein IJT21_06720 [Synergistaceae bacterium]|nr:hypothetical protein [Synergistaceae bacterium]